MPSLRCYVDKLGISARAGIQSPRLLDTPVLTLETELQPPVSWSARVYACAYLLQDY